MKTYSLTVLLFVAALLAGASPAVVRAQAAPLPSFAPVASPTPMPLSNYSDLGMDFVAPPGAAIVGRRILPVAGLGEDLQPVAIWAVYPGRPEVRVIKIEMEAFTGEPSQWEGQFESQTHNTGEGVLIKHKTPMALTNGMPATFVEVTYGSGFDAKKEFAVVFADGQRGIVISETGRIGEITAEEAQKFLANAKAVRYPLDRETKPPE